MVCKIVKLISTSCTFCSINTRLTAAHTSVSITLQAGGVSRIAVTGRAACPTVKVISDDLAVLADVLKDATCLPHSIERTAKEIGFYLNADKTEFI